MENAWKSMGTGAVNIGPNGTTHRNVQPMGASGSCSAVTSKKHLVSFSF